MHEPLAEEMREQLQQLVWRGLAGPAALLEAFAEYQPLLSQSAADYVAAWEAAGHTREETEQEVERLLQVGTAIFSSLGHGQVSIASKHGVCHREPGSTCPAWRPLNSCFFCTFAGIISDKCGTFITCKTKHGAGQLAQ